MTDTFLFPQSRCRAGVARVDVTPPVGIYHRMWGAAAHDRSTGVHRPLTATALALEPLDAASGEPLVVVAVDHCLLWRDEMERLLNDVAAAAEVGRERIVVWFSHTHAAGLMDLARRELPGGELIEEYLSELGRKVGAAAREALARRRPATIDYATGRCALAANRDYFDGDRGQYVCGFNPEGRADDTLLLARVTADGESAPLATLLNYACHPTTLAWDNTLISPDFVGAARELIESRTAAPCLFVQGASGDIGPRDGFVGLADVADANGRQLGYAALSAFESLPPPGSRLVYAGAVVSGATIGTWNYRPATEGQTRAAETWVEHVSPPTVPLPYRADLPDADRLRDEKRRWLEEEAAQRAAGDAEAAAESRAMAERAQRRLTRAAALPPGDDLPYPLRVWRFGEAIWIALDGEHYNVLQRELRSRFPDVPLVLGTLANGSIAWYLPDAESYGKGLYQEEASILARGSLEKLIDALAAAIQNLMSAA